MEMREKTLLHTSQLLEGLPTRVPLLLPPPAPSCLLSAMLAPRSSRKRPPLTFPATQALPWKLLQLLRGLGPTELACVLLVRVQGLW